VKNFLDTKLQMWYWRKMERINWTDRVRSEALHRVNEESNILQRVKRRNANWIGHILRRNCLLKDVTEGNVEGKNGSDGKMRKTT
jgi:hypothetical protein